MSSFSFDSTHFSEQLGIYDFFSVLVSGSAFIFGLCAISTKFFHFLWDDINVGKGFGILTMIYLVGLIFQELGNIADHHFWKVRSSYRKNFLNTAPIADEDLGYDTKLFKNINAIFFKSKNEQSHVNNIIKNPNLMRHCRKIAKDIIGQLPTEERIEIIGANDAKWETVFQNGPVCSYVFWICQYYVSVSGKGQKAEKLRGLFAMSKALTACFACLSLVSLLSLGSHLPFLSFFTPPSALYLFNIPLGTIVFPCLAILFRLRMSRVKRNLILTTLGNYDALLRISKESRKTEQP